MKNTQLITAVVPKRRYNILLSRLENTFTTSSSQMKYVDESGLEPLILEIGK